MNVELLLKVKAAIIAEPQRFDMNNWYSSAIPEKHLCDSAFCISGWAVALCGQDGITKVCTALKLDCRDDAFVHGQILLNLDGDQRIRLFFEEHWPNDLRQDLFYIDPGTAEYADIAARRIDRFIATDGRE